MDPATPPWLADALKLAQSDLEASRPTDLAATCVRIAKGEPHYDPDAEWHVRVDRRGTWIAMYPVLDNEDSPGSRYFVADWLADVYIDECWEAYPRCPSTSTHLWPTAIKGPRGGTARPIPPGDGP